MKPKLTNKAIGDKAEKKAQIYLEQLGYNIIAKNYRFKRCEIDIIAEKEKTIIFIEVKKRKNHDFGFPEDFVKPEQEDRIRDAAEEFLTENQIDGDIRFDVISISSSGNLEHFQDCF